MREQQIHGIIGRIRDDLVLEAEPRRLAALYREAEAPASSEATGGGVILSDPIGEPKKNKRRFKKWLPMVVAAAVALTVGLNVWLISGMNDLIGQGGLTPPSGTPSGNPFGDLFGSLFPFLSPETETPHEVTVRDPEESTEPEDSTESEDTRTECQKGNHEWALTVSGDATCYRTGNVTYGCVLCGETKTEAERLPHSYEEGYCAVCGLVEGAWEDVGFSRAYDEEGKLYAIIHQVQGSPEGLLILPNIYYDEIVEQLIPVTEIGKNALTGLDKITEVVIPDTVTRICEYAFKGCSAMERVNFPDGLISIGSHAFNSCTALLEAHLPDSVTELNGSIFTNCTSLVSTTFPVEPDTIPFSMYGNCKSLTEVNIRGNIVRIGDYAFSNCRSLTELPNMPNLEVVGSHAFEYCHGLTEITLPATLREISHYAFTGCSSLKKVTILAPSLYGIYTYAFASCPALEEVTLPAVVGVLTGQNMFSSCTSLTTIYCTGTVAQWEQYFGRKGGLQVNQKITVICTDGTTTVS
jgi:hypothetical protein